MTAKHPFPLFLLYFSLLFFSSTFSYPLSNSLLNYTTTGCMDKMIFNSKDTHPKFVQISSLPEVFGTGLLNGSTNLKFLPTKSIILRSLVVDDPDSFRPGLGSFTKLLIRDHRYCRQMSSSVYNFLNTEYPKILEVLSFDPTFSGQLLPCCWTLVSFNLLGLLDSINITPLVNHIKSYQQADGGFKADWSNVTGVEPSFWSVCALVAVGELPENVTGLRDFLYGLQVGDYPSYPRYNGFFKPWYPREEGEFIIPGYPSTYRACHILKLLNFNLPHRDVLLANLQDRFTSFLDNFSLIDYQSHPPKYTQGFGDSIGLAFAINAQDILLKLKDFCWQIHDSLPNESFSLGDGDFSHHMSKCGNAGHKLKFFLSSATFDPYIDTPQIFSLKIFNPSPYEYSFYLHNLSSSLDGLTFNFSFPKEVLSLGFNQSLEFPITIFLDSTVKKNSLSSIPFKLSLDIEIAGLIYGEDSDSTSWVGSEIFFELPVKKNLSPAALGALIAVPTLGTVGVTGGLIARKRKKQLSSK